MAHAFGSLDELGERYGLRKVRRALGIPAFELYSGGGA
jgi:hypothetical protein